MKDKKCKCQKCKDKGYIEYYSIDINTIYRWQKPKTRKCKCKGEKR